jgi:hypothetical protein
MWSLSSWYVSLSEAAASAWLDVGEYLLLVASLVVAIGVWGENRKSSPEWVSRHSFFAALVTLGVAGELLGDGDVFIFSKRLQAIEETGIASANERAGDASKAAGDADAKAESFRLQIAEANERAETARLEQEKLKQLVQWRTIDPANMKVLIAELAKGSGEIDIAFAPSDPETEYFALKIIGEDAFSAANDSGSGLKWHVYLRQWITNGMFFGIAIPGPENNEVKFLRHAFSAAHIEFSTGNPPEEVPPINLGGGLKFAPPPKHDALIVIGLRKPPL